MRLLEGPLFKQRQRMTRLRKREDGSPVVRAVVGARAFYVLWGSGCRCVTLMVRFQKFCAPFVVFGVESAGTPFYEFSR